MYRKISTFVISIIALSALERAESATLRYYSAYEYLTAPQVHYLAVGVRASFKYVTFELSNGVKQAKRSERDANKPNNGTLLGVHLYPFHSSDKRDRFVMSFTHLSDIFRGKPFNGREEPVDHFIGIGYTMQRNSYETDLLFGKESHDCSLDRRCEYTNQLKATIRYFF